MKHLWIKTVDKLAWRMGLPSVKIRAASKGIVTSKDKRIMKKMMVNNSSSINKRNNHLPLLILNTKKDCNILRWKCRSWLGTKMNELTHSKQVKHHVEPVNAQLIITLFCLYSKGLIDWLIDCLLHWLIDDKWEQIYTQ